ncbi:MAG: zinc-dependent peptidase [Planctomycetaceae bacterium]|nr:zinc-dependent peptidase [Planctomycetaceae bacterium]
MFGWFKQRRRRKLLASPMPEEWLGYIERNVRHWAYLDDTQRARLSDRLRIIVAEKDWAPATGFQVTDEVRVTIAAQAAIMLLGIDADYYFDDVRTIVVYPGAFTRPDDPFDMADGDVENALLGESWHRGPIVLSWQHVLKAGHGLEGGANVVFHEFAHRLDGLDGDVEGMPPLAHGEQTRRWYRVTESEYLKLVGNARRGEVTLLNHYGATNLAEFFAVATECFFERPRALRQWHHELYGLLAEFYHQDPALWLADAAASEGDQQPRPRRRRAKRQGELESSDDYFSRGISFLNDEQYAAAVADFDRVIATKPDDGEALVHRAVAKLHLDDLPGSLADCEQALQVDPRDLEARRMRGSVLLELGRLDESIADLNQVLRELPDDPDARFLRGRAALASGQAQQALADLNRAVGADPHDAESYAHRGRAFELLGRLDEARADYARARQLEPELNLDFDHGT